MKLYVTYPIPNSYTTTWDPSPNTRIHSITMTSICIVWFSLSFVFSIPHYIHNVRYAWHLKNPAWHHPFYVNARQYHASMRPRLKNHYSNPHNDNWCILFYIVLLRSLHYSPKRLVCCMMQVDPIEADLISYSKIHGQPCFYIDPLSIPRPQAMGETALVIQEATSTTTVKLTWERV